VRFRTVIEDGSVALEITQAAGADCTVTAELRAEDGGSVAAAGRETGARLRLAVPQAALWQAGNVHRYLLLVRVSRGEETVAALRRTVGLRTSEVAAVGRGDGAAACGTAALAGVGAARQRAGNVRAFRGVQPAGTERCERVGAADVRRAMGGRRCGSTGSR
jgi:hypothetical protein